MSAGLFATLSLQCVFNRLDLALGTCNLALFLAPHESNRPARGATGATDFSNVSVEQGATNDQG